MPQLTIPMLSPPHTKGPPLSPFTFLQIIKNVFSILNPHLAGVLATLGQAGADHRVEDRIGIGVGPEYYNRVRRNKHFQFVDLHITLLVRDNWDVNLVKLVGQNESTLLDNHLENVPRLISFCKTHTSCPPSCDSAGGSCFSFLTLGCIFGQGL